jgi:hypothetical protein
LQATAELAGGNSAPQWLFQCGLEIPAEIISIARFNLAELSVAASDIMHVLSGVALQRDLILDSL